jgi:putative oxygen-independent coproporphyrinogen III oxidase
MAGIYIHIPFCKQACHYCDFHFSTNLKKKEELVKALSKELELRNKEINEPIETIYLGGGTPSLLSHAELSVLFDVINDHYDVIKDAEITLEANPDDLSKEKLIEFSKSPINRLSIGVQSFFDTDLKLMNRAHHAKEALESIQFSQRLFENLSIDLIYGIPGMSNERWIANLEKAFDLKVPHLSCYALTVEPKTALQAFIQKGIVPPVEDEVAQEHHQLLIDKTEEKGFINYEFSNFGKEGFESKNNMAYWLGKSYLGIGPSAHSYDGHVRSWNVANNAKYLKSMEVGELPLEREMLSKNDKYNEFVMTRLRTQWGINLKEVKVLFGENHHDYLIEQAQLHVDNQLLYVDGNSLKVSKKGKFLSDGIASDLFLLNLE